MIRPLLHLIKSIFGSSKSQPQEITVKPVEPTSQEMQFALSRLNELVNFVIFGEIGGVEPQKNNRAKSWWGGNFLATEGEGIPICKQSGRSMHPILQIRVDELPEVPSAFKGFVLINIWMDLQGSELWRGTNGNGFLVRTYTDIENLVPLGFGYRESSALPTFPVLWQKTTVEQPSWEDMADEVPTNVARASADDWFFKSQYSSEQYHDFRSKYPIKVGGWPAWIQGSDWPKNAKYAFQVDSTFKGKLGLGDNGSFYIFKTPDNWEIRSDCY
ncbi:MAG: DUF1963 domain-containing protein [Rhizobiales bacterium]|nr:DUF1963 domain-containing protein [Hyphomicrobiales bacterium]